MNERENLITIACTNGQLSPQYVVCHDGVWVKGKGIMCIIMTFKWELCNQSSLYGQIPLSQGSHHMQPLNKPFLLSAKINGTQEKYFESVFCQSENSFELSMTQSMLLHSHLVKLRLVIR